MSLGVAIKGTEGIVLAADSRVTLTAKVRNAPQFNVHFDNATKLLTFGRPNLWLGAVTWGDAVMGTTPKDLRTAHSFVPEFEAGLPDTRLSAKDFAEKLSEFYLTQWQNRMPADYIGSGMIFVVGGFDKDAPYGAMYKFNIPKQPVPEEQSKDDFGIAWGGQPEFASRLIHGYDPNLLQLVKQKLQLSDKQVTSLAETLRPLNMGIPYAVLSLQDCIDVAIFLLRTTIEAQSLSVRLRGVGGAIDVAVITRREGLEVTQQKELVGERTTQQGGQYYGRQRYNRRQQRNNG